MIDGYCAQGKNVERMGMTRTRVLGVVLLLAVVALAVWWFRRRERFENEMEG